MPLKKGRIRRLNYLHLSSGECITLELQVLATYHDPVTNKQLLEKGVLYVCSKSFVFEPQRPLLALLVCPFNSLVEGPELDKTLTQQISVSFSKIVEINTSGSPSPFSFHYLSIALFIFKLEENSLALKTINWTNKLIETLKIEHSIEEPIYHVVQMILQEKGRKEFDRKNLESVNETFKLTKQILAKRILPMTAYVYGFIYITDRNFYFEEILAQYLQPLLCVSFVSIHRIVKRRFELQHTALEIWSEEDFLYLNFRDKETRDDLYNLLVSLVTKICSILPSVYDLSEKWQNCLISNFDYIYELNFLAHRSFNDFSQYPIFPWIISDFDSEKLNLEDSKIYRDLSKPIGALNPERLELFHKRFRNFSGPENFLYGTHYSTPGYVAGYLFRTQPLFMLHLQNGKFDLPDRLFSSIKTDWINCFTQESCVKELIPQFYMEDPAFLENRMGLNLGFTHDKKSVGDVVLPVWASSSKQFLQINRQALESEFVSQHLHLWIDLIFGWKQCGEQALKSDNLFLPSSYEGVINLALIQDPYERRALRDQIQEYGQTPAQLFSTPHPKRKNFLMIPSTLYQNPKETQYNFLHDNFQSQDISTNISSIAKVSVSSSLQIIIQNPFKKEILCIYSNGILKFFSEADLKEEKTFKLEAEDIIKVAFLEKIKLIVGLFSGEMIIFNTSWGKELERIIVSSTAITCLLFEKQNCLVFVATADCSINSWKLQNDKLSDYPTIIEEDAGNEVLFMDMWLNSKRMLFILDCIGTIKAYMLEKLF